MAPLALCVALFAFWVIVGWAVLVGLGARRDPVYDLLLAPSVGIAATLVPVFLANYTFGQPVDAVGRPITVCLGVASVVMLAWRQPGRPSKRYLAFLPVFAFALLMIGRPMLEFGFDWISFANDDMANYVLGAQFFLNHTYTFPPDPTTLVQGADYSQFYWYFYVPHAVRSGSELLLAWLMSVSGLAGHQAFMPLILSLHIGLISAAAALVYRGRELWAASLVTAALLAASALSTYGVLAQLLAQAGGLSLLAAAASLLTSPGNDLCQLDGQRALATSGVLQRGALLGLLTAALLLVYPEVLPFLVLGFGLTVTIGVLRRRINVGAILVQSVVAAAVSLVLINAYIVDVVIFMSMQVSGGLRPSSNSELIFPYFLIPSGLANFWGLQAITHFGPEPWLSITIGVGAVLLLSAAIAAMVMTWRGHPSAAIATGMLLLGVRLFSQQADFGLFKLAMFLQPFMLGSVAVAAVGAVRRARWALVPLAAVGIAGLGGQIQYVELSRDGYTEIPNGSHAHIMEEFRTALDGRQSGHVVLDTINISLAKFQAAYTRGLQTTFPSRDFFSYIVGRGLEQSPLAPGTLAPAIRVRQAIDDRIMPEFFALHDPDNTTATDQFPLNTLGDTAADPGCDVFISTGATQSIFNRRASEAQHSPDFTAAPCGALTNHLVFVHSLLGQHYYQVDPHYFGDQPGAIGIFPLEPDVELSGRTMAGVGRYLLFEAINPTAQARVVLNMTASLKSDGDDRLPPAVVIGDARAPFPLQGRGSARVISAPVTPQVIGGRSYLAVDMGIEGQRFADHRSGLMGLYNSTIPIDRRELVGFARDISLVSDQEYARLSPPSMLQNFPDDLLNADLQYSGIYEDGWVSESAYFDLQQPDAASTLSIKCTVPLIGDPGFTQTVGVLVDGTEVARQQTAVGDLDIESPVALGGGRHRVELRFSGLQTLPGGDGRPVAALLHSVGFVPGEHRT